MRSSDWSSDVFSSDRPPGPEGAGHGQLLEHTAGQAVRRRHAGGTERPDQPLTLPEASLQPAKALDSAGNSRIAFRADILPRPAAIGHRRLVIPVELPFFRPDRKSTRLNSSH